MATVTVSNAVRTHAAPFDATVTDFTATCDGGDLTSYAITAHEGAMTGLIHLEAAHAGAGSIVIA